MPKDRYSKCSCRTDKNVFEAGEVASSMYVVQEGEIEILIGDRVVETLGVGGPFGEMSLIDDSPRAATARAKVDSRLVVIDEEMFKLHVQRVPYFAVQMLRVLAERLRNMDSNLR